MLYAKNGTEVERGNVIWQMCNISRSLFICYIFANCNHINVIHSEPKTHIHPPKTTQQHSVPSTQCNRKHLPTCRQHFEELFLILFRVFCPKSPRISFHASSIAKQNEIHASLHTIRHKCCWKLLATAITWLICTYISIYICANGNGFINYKQNLRLKYFVVSPSSRNSFPTSPA